MSQLNTNNVATMWGTFIDGNTIKYGYTEGGMAFVAVNGKRLTFKEAFERFGPKYYKSSTSFYVNISTRYDMTMKGLVRYLVDKYNKD